MTNEQEPKKDLIFWSNNAEEGVKYKSTTWWRSVGIGNFLNDVLKENDIVGIIMRPSSKEESENIFGFILKDKVRK